MFSFMFRTNQTLSEAFFKMHPFQCCFVNIIITCLKRGDSVGVGSHRQAYGPLFESGLVSCGVGDLHCAPSTVSLDMLG